MKPPILKQPQFKQKARPAKKSKPAQSGGKIHPSISKEQKQIMGKFAPRRLQPLKEEAEFGPGKKEFVICKDCHSVYYDKSWHYGLEDYKHFKKDKRFIFKICPACQMIKNKQYEGMITIENFPKESVSDLINLVHNFGRRATERDPMDRVIGIKNKKNKIIITTTENKLAVMIAKQIVSAFKNFKAVPHYHRCVKASPKECDHAFKNLKISPEYHRSETEDVVHIRLSA